MGISDEQASTYENCIDMNTPGMIRVSFGIYNTEEEVDQFLEILNNIVTDFRKSDEFLVMEDPSF